MGQIEFDEQEAGLYPIRKSFAAEEKTKMTLLLEGLGVPAAYTKYVMILVIIVFFAISIFIAIGSTGSTSPTLPPSAELAT